MAVWPFGGTRQRVCPQGGVDDEGGAAGCVGEPRQWLWPRRTASVAMVALGHEVDSDREEGMRTREWARGSGGCWASPGEQLDSRGRCQREAGGGGLPARVRLHLCLLAEEEDERGGKWVGPVKLGRLQVSGPGRFLSPLSHFCFMFSNISILF